MHIERDVLMKIICMNMKMLTPIVRPVGVLMRPVALIIMTLLLVTSCGIVRVNEDAICDGTQRLRDAHTDALISDGGQRSVKTGAALIAALDAGCQSSY